MNKELIKQALEQAGYKPEFVSHALGEENAAIENFEPVKHFENYSTRIGDFYKNKMKPEMEAYAQEFHKSKFPAFLNPVKKLIADGTGFPMDEIEKFGNDYKAAISAAIAFQKSEGEKLLLEAGKGANEEITKRFQKEQADKLEAQKALKEFQDSYKTSLDSEIKVLKDQAKAKDVNNLLLGSASKLTLAHDSRISNVLKSDVIREAIEKFEIDPETGFFKDKVTGAFIEKGKGETYQDVSISEWMKDQLKDDIKKSTGGEGGEGNLSTKNIVVNGKKVITGKNSERIRKWGQESSIPKQ